MIVCQVLQRGDRISFLWSEGAAAFEPYDLTGTDKAQFEHLAGEARRRLGEALTAGVPQALEAVAQVGHQLYRAVFRSDAVERGPAAEIQEWLTRQTPDGQPQALEILSDMPGRVPWNLVCEQPTPDAFWGWRYNLANGRRVNPLRATPLLERPAALLVLDPDLGDVQGMPQLAPWQDAGTLVTSADGLAARLRREAPDLLVLVCGAEAGGLRLGPDRVPLAALRGWIDEATEGNPDPIVLLLGVGPASVAAAWEAMIAGATGLLDGLVASEVPLPAPDAIQL